MTTHFNKLTPAEAERLAMLAEEAAEVIQIVGKILRHGYENYHPDNPHEKNRVMLARELADLLSIIDRMVLDHDLNMEQIEGFYCAGTHSTWNNKKRFTYHQG